MQLSFIMIPTVDGTRMTVDDWRSAGLQELWRPDDHTVLLGIEQSAQVMVQDDPDEWDLGHGPVFLVDDVASMPEPERGWSIEPTTVATGGYAAAVIHGLAVRYLDLTSCPPEYESVFR